MSTQPISNSAPLKNDLGERLTHKFLGKTSDFADKAEKAFYQKMLRYYLKGHSFMPFGKNIKGEQQYIPVLQEYSYVPNISKEIVTN